MPYICWSDDVRRVCSSSHRASSNSSSSGCAAGSGSAGLRPRSSMAIVAIVESGEADTSCRSGAAVGIRRCEEAAIGFALGFLRGRDLGVDPDPGDEEEEAGILGRGRSQTSSARSRGWMAPHQTARSSSSYNVNEKKLFREGALRFDVRLWNPKVAMKIHTFLSNYRVCELHNQKTS